EETFGFTEEPLGAALLAEAIFTFIAESPLLAALLAVIALGVWPSCRLALAAQRAPVRLRRYRLGPAAAACGLATLAFWALAWGAASFVIGFPAPVAVLITGVTGALILVPVALAERRQRRAAAA